MNANEAIDILKYSNREPQLVEAVEAVAQRIDTLHATLHSILNDCERGAHTMGMTPAGVQDIVNRIVRVL